MEENTTQERKHLRKDVPQMVKQQLPNHKLHKAATSESVSKQQPQSESVSEQQPQSKTTTDTQEEHVPSQFSSDDDESLPDAFPTSTKTFETKDPKSIPKKPKYNLRPKILHI